MRYLHFTTDSTGRRDATARWRGVVVLLLTLWVAPRLASAASVPAPASTNAWPAADFLVQRVVERSAWNEEK